MSEWAARHRVVVGGDAPGPWRNERTPYLRDIMDAACDDTLRQITVKKGSQSAGTEALINIIAWTIDRSPGLCMLVYPDAASASDKNVTRILPQFEASPALAARLLPSKRTRNTRFIRFDRCDLHFRGSFSEHKLESDPCRLVGVDELDRCPPRTAHLARQRIKTFALGKLVVVGKPGIKGRGIDDEYEASDMRRYHVPCPRCGTYHVRAFAMFRWEGRNKDGAVVWDSRDLDASPARVKETACCRCPSCGGRIGAELHHWQLALGVWASRGQRVAPLAAVGIGPIPGFRDDDPYAQPDAVQLADHWGDTPGILLGERPAGDHAGFHVPEWISGMVANPYAPAAEGFVRRKGEIDADWLADHAGEAWSDTSPPVEIGVLRERCTPPEAGGYRLGQVPAGVLALLAAVDVQRDRCVVEVRGLGAFGKDRWLIWHEEVPAPEFGDLSPLDELLYRRRFTRPDGSAMPIWARVIDSGDGARMDQVYEYCGARRACFPCKGVGSNRGGRPMDKLYAWSRPETYPDGRPLKRSVHLLRVNSPAWKSAVLRRLRVRGESDRVARPEIDGGEAPPEVLAAGESGGLGLWRFPADTADEYFRQLTAEECVRRQVSGRTIHEWRLRQGRTDNHYFDCAVYLEALAEALGVRQRLGAPPIAPVAAAGAGIPEPDRGKVTEQGPPPVQEATLRSITKDRGMLAARRRERDR